MKYREKLSQFGGASEGHRDAAAPPNEFSRQAVNGPIDGDGELDGIPPVTASYIKNIYSAIEN
mgnify:FL=1